MDLYNITNDIEHQINNQSLLIINLKLILDKSELISLFNKRFYEIQIQIPKMSKIFKYLNNIRVLLLSRKYVNRILSYEVENNNDLKISKSYYLNDIINEKNVYFSIYSSDGR